MKGSPAYLRAPALACRMTGAPTSSAALITACTCSRLLTLKAGNAVAVLGGVVEQLAHGDERHGGSWSGEEAEILEGGRPERETPIL